MRGRRPHASAGFTLVELLLVIVIVGVVVGALGWVLIRTLRQNELRDAGTQLAADLRRSRRDAQQTGQPSTLTLSAARTSYTLRVGAAASTREVPGGILIEPERGGSAVTHLPPFGTLDTAGVVWKLQSPYRDLSLFVKVVGVTGKVMLSASAD